MSLEPEKRGFQTGQPSANPQGRPRGASGRKTIPKIAERILGKWHTHPADKLVELAKYLTANGRYGEAAEIWTNLLKYFEPTKKPVESAPEKTSPQEAKEAAEETFRLLQEIENGTSTNSSGSQTVSMDTGQTKIFTETGSEEDLRQHPEK